jgi:hypothetical protein
MKEMWKKFVIGIFDELFCVFRLLEQCEERMGLLVS